MATGGRDAARPAAFPAGRPVSGVRGAGKSPGAYRRAPNWIGPPGCAIDEAAFVLIGADRLVDAMSAWERYIHHGAP